MGCRLDLGGGGAMIVLFCKKLPHLWGMFLFIREMNEPVTPKLFTTNHTNRVVHVFKVFSKYLRSYLLKLNYIFGHVLIANSRCYGRCYVKKLIPLCTFLKFHTHLEENSTTSFQSFFDKSSRVLSLVFPRNWIFHEHRHILGYHTPYTWREF